MIEKQYSESELVEGVSSGELMVITRKKYDSIMNTLEMIKIAFPKEPERFDHPYDPRRCE